MSTTIPVLYPMGGNADEKRLPNIWGSKDWVAERKYDGIRYLLRHEMDGSVKLTSRTKSVKTGLPTDKADNVPHLVELAKKTPRGTVLDGEVITHVNCTSSEVQEIMGCDSDEAIARQEQRGYVTFVAYDILYVNGQDLTNREWSERRKHLQNLTEDHFDLTSYKYFTLSGYRECAVFDAEAWYNEIVESGGEGIMLKRKKSKYQAGDDKMKKPANTWVKVKKWITADVVIIGFTDAEVEYTGKEIETWKYWQDENGVLWEVECGKKCADRLAKERGLTLHPITKYHFNGWIGAVKFGQYDKNGKFVEVGKMSGMDESIRAYLTENKEECIGRVVEVRAMERIKKTLSLRHPEWHGWRDDKKPEECIIGEF